MFVVVFKSNGIYSLYPIPSDETTFITNRKFFVPFSHAVPDDNKCFDKFIILPESHPRTIQQPKYCICLVGSPLYNVFYLLYAVKFVP